MKRDMNAIIRKMTLEEKASLCSGKDTWRLKAVERLGIPSVMVSDGPHGLRKQEEKSDHLGINNSIQAVCFPAACAAAASFDTELMEQIGDALGEECRGEDIAVLLGPAINIKRSPLCGRNFEYFSEDPYLTGKLAAAQIQGLQRHGVGACLKHFAANNQEYRRMTSSSEMDTRTLHEIYLRGFEIAVKESKPWTVMSSYNRLNGVYVGESEELLTGTLRNKWEFDGFVMSDWGAVNDRVNAMVAGLDLEMPYSDGSGDQKLIAAVRQGLLEERILDEAVSRILKIVFRYLDAGCQKVGFDRAKHHEIAAEAAKKCAVLLKNNGVLPLNRDLKIAYIGPFAKTPRYQGSGSSHVNAYQVTDAFMAAKNRENISYAKGFDIRGEALSEEQIQEALKTAQRAEVAVIFAGLPDIYESESYDRKHMRLPESQNELIEKIAAIQPNTVVVLHIGSPVEMPWVNQVAAILNMYLGGEGVEEAVDALLYGDVDPSGRLPESFPLRLEDTPCYLYFPGDGEKAVYAEGIYVGYRYYDAKKMEVLYPFGHGLSYTEFEYVNMSLSKEEIGKGEMLTVRVTVKNIGDRTGTETVQIYTKASAASYSQLMAFGKVTLLPKEEKEISLCLSWEAFAYYNEKIGAWYCPGGEFLVLAAHSSRDSRLSSIVHVKESHTIPMVVDENTTIAQLMAHSATRQATEQMLTSFRAALTSNREGGMSQEESLMMREMAINVPLRSLPTFKLVTMEQVHELIDKMNDFIIGNCETI